MYVKLALLTLTPAIWQLRYLAEDVNHPVATMRELFCRYLHSRLFPDDAEEPDIDELPFISATAKIRVHSSAAVVYHAPSESCGRRGMHREIIRCTPLWYKLYPRYDTVLITTRPDTWEMLRFRVARVRRLLSFHHHDTLHECAFVEWFTTDESGPDARTGMWQCAS